MSSFPVALFVCIVVRYFRISASVVGRNVNIGFGVADSCANLVDTLVSSFAGKLAPWIWIDVRFK